MKIAIIVAMDNEASQVRKLLHGEDHGKIGGNEIHLFKSGVGKVNAALQTQEIIRTVNPDCILSSGCAGGIGKDVKVMDWVVGEEVVYHDVDCGPGNLYGQVQDMPARYQAHPSLVDAARKLNSQGDVHCGLICTGDVFVSGKEKLQPIKNHFPEGLAVEMESAAIAQTCFIHHVPFLSFRIISDNPFVENHVETYNDFWKEMANRSFSKLKALLESLPINL